MNEYVVSCGVLELPKGSFFTVFPGAEVLPGQLCLFDLEGHEIVGRRYCDGEIRLPGHRILTDGVSCRVVGPVVPVEMTVKPITNLSDGEWERLAENPSPRSLDS
jgi:hypothetical protein